MQHRRLALLAAVVAAFAVFAGTAQAYRGYGYAWHHDGSPFVGTVFAYNYSTGAVGMTNSDWTGWYSFGGLNAGTWYNFWICTRDHSFYNFDAVVFQQTPYSQQHNLKADENDQGCW